MPLPCLPPPPVCRDKSACIAWLELALTSSLELFRDIIRYEVFITPEAERELCALQQWLHFAVNTERQRRRDGRRVEICWRRTWFCYRKYEDLRKNLTYDATRQTVSLQTGSLQQTPATAV
ncbi:E4 ORF4 [Baboon adenovirus 3]|uniref:E4 ORF4 n=1 Tax=Simian mastadenovirus C TaxID=1962300 RepID=M9YVF3_9ADEN|nr:E4 ORF4 [Baboon adenovirus 3]AGK27156.1 E4 ORF4 [Baboon adenovirus 3]AGK27228.1 E4 ORF4 [Simian mastadenovirus C]